MSDYELATFFVHWLAYAIETDGVIGLVKAAEKVRAHSRFKGLPERVQGNIEGFIVGAAAVKEGYVR